MKNNFISYIVIIMSLISFTAFSQTEDEQELLGLPGDNLDLYAVLDLFQQAKTIEDFEKSLNEESTGVNNLDLNNDDKVDFIKVETKKDGDNFMFILQDPISETETQDVAVIYVSKDKEEKVNIQIVGDETLYGKNYTVEPNTKENMGVTANPAYKGDDPVVVTAPSSTTVVVVEAAPIVQYVYSPVYVPYYPPYYWGYYPPYWRPFAITAIAIYRHNHWHHHGRYHYSARVSHHHHHHHNNYNRNVRHTSVTVNNNIKRGNFNTAGKGTRPSTAQRPSTTKRPSTGTGASTRPAAGTSKPSTRPSTGTGASTRPATGNSKPSTRPSTGTGASTRPATKPSTKPSTRPSTTQRPSTSQYKSPSMNSGSRSRASSSYSRPSSAGSMSRGGGGGRRR